MRLIDADALDKHIYNDVPVSRFGSIRRMAAVRELIEEAPTIESIYGYKIEDLILVAETLRKEWVSPRDLINYHDNLKLAFKIVREEHEKAIEKYIEEIGADI